MWAISNGLEKQQLFEGAVMGAVQSAFVADQQGQALAMIGHLLEGKGQAVNRFHFGEALLFDFGVEVFGAAQGLVVQKGGFDGGGAAEAPARGGHGMDQFDFDAGLGSELVEVSVEEGLEIFDGFGGEHHTGGRPGRGFGAQAVADAVAG